jgi:cytochrome c oxidase subunit II
MKRICWGIALVLGVVALLLATWFSQQSANGDSAQQNPQALALALAEQRGCSACHSTDGSQSIGPTWLGSYGSTRTFVDGSTAVVDAAYLRQSILQPQQQVVAGYQNLMVPPQLSDVELDTLIQLIRELGAAKTP